MATEKAETRHCEAQAFVILRMESLRGALGFTSALFRASIIALLTLASYFIGHYFEYGTLISLRLLPTQRLARGMTMAFFDAFYGWRCSTFNMRSPAWFHLY